MSGLVIVDDLVYDGPRSIEEAARRLRRSGFVEAAIAEGRVVLGLSPVSGLWRDDLFARLASGEPWHTEIPPCHGKSFLGRYLAELEAVGRWPSKSDAEALRRASVRLVVEVALVGLEEK